MDPNTPRAARIRRLGRTPIAALAGIVVIGCSLSGCSVIKAIHKAVNNYDVVKNFTSKLNNPPKTFEVTYTTTGSSPATIVYAVQPPMDVALKVTPTGSTTSNAEDFISNSSGVYSCTPSSGSTGGSAPWTCDKNAKTVKVTQSAIVGIYTPQHWFDVLEGAGIVAGITGNAVTTSTKTVNGYSLQCLDLKVSNITANKTGSTQTSSQSTTVKTLTGTLCTTSQGLLGYVNVSTDSTSFEITKYATAPTSSLFNLPAGAKVTTVTTPKTTTSKSGTSSTSSTSTTATTT